MTLLLSHTACLDHVTPPGHPERPDRLRAVAEVLGEERFKPLVRGEAPEGSLDSVTLCHGEHYVGELRHIAPQSGMIYINGDTSMSPGTWEAVMRGVGGDGFTVLTQGTAPLIGVYDTDALHAYFQANSPVGPTTVDRIVRIN